MDTSKLQGRRFKNQEELLEALKVLYAEDKIEYSRQRGDDTQFPINENDQWIILNDCLEGAGSASDYFFQDMWAAREIYRSNRTRESSLA